MLKKILLALLFIIFLSALTAAYFYFRRVSIPPAKIIKAIPANAALIIESRNISNTGKKLSEASAFWKDLLYIESVRKLDMDIRLLDSILTANKQAAELINSESTFISIHMTGANSFDFLYVFGLQNRAQISYVDELIKRVAGDLGLSPKESFYSKRIYDKVTINEIQLNSKNGSSNPMFESETFSYTFLQNIFIGSFNSLLVEDAIRQLNTGKSLLNDRSFKKVKKTAGSKSDANIYLNYEIFPRFLGSFLNPASKRYVQLLSDLANWAEVDVKIKPDAIMLNGLTFTDDSTDQYMNLFIKQEPQKIELTKILPSNTAAILYFGVNNFKVFYEDYKVYLENTNKIYDHKKKIDKINAMYNIDVEHALLSWMGNEFAIVYTSQSHPDPGIVPGQEAKASYNAYAVFRILTKGEESMKNVQNTLEGIIEDISKIPDINPELVENTPLTNETVSLEKEFRDHTIGLINLPDVLQTLLGHAFKPIKNNFYSIIHTENFGDYVVFGNSIASLKGFINADLSGNTLLTDIHYNSFADNISSKANCYFFFNIPASIDLLKTFTGDAFSESIDSNKVCLKKFEAIAIQLSSGNLPASFGFTNSTRTGKMFYTNAYLSYNPGYKEKTQSFRQAKLDTSICSQPQIVFNHYTKEKEIFLQDNANKIYLIENSGMILWKEQLPGKIISDIYQIDVYENNKLQLLFNTKTHIYLIDRKGKSVENYPIKLKAQATNGIAVFDYDKNKKYRIIIACNDNNIYNYDKNGEIVKGWEFDRTKNTVEANIKHFSVSGKDHIVIIDKKGKVYVVDRSGKPRIKITKQFNYLINNTYFIEKAKDISKCRILTTDSTGKVISIYFNNNTDSSEFNSFLSTPFFIFDDINNDGAKDYILLDKNQLYIYNRDKSLIYSYIFDHDISHKPFIFSFPENITRIGVVSDKTNELFLFDPDGTLYGGFPMYGNTPFNIAGSIKGTEDWLVTGAEGNFIYIYPVK
ncbi:MAG: DUF3352 domain-containing protein [Bacteroidota bacterium]